MAPPSTVRRIVPYAPTAVPVLASGKKTPNRFCSVTLRVIKSLLDTGVALQRVRAAVEYLQEIEVPAHGVTLFSDGKGVYQADSPDAVVDLLRNGQGVFAIAVDKVWNDLEITVARSAKKGRAAAGGS